ncbi:MAG: response regulator transcription factor [Planctomycetaceae bacterium]|nr:response regulator transcription factor [Planctomycetaceae bacterium]
MNPIRVMLADDHDLVRAGLRALLEKIPGIEVIGEAADGREALRQIEALTPDVVLMDVMMPELNGLEATARAASQFPKTRIVILSMNSGEEFVMQALQAGAAGYLLKNINPAELETAIKAVARGETFLSPAIPKQVIDACLSNHGGPTSSLQKLTQRQREVLQLIVEGNSTKLIASKLGISAKTVESHRADLMTALSIHDVAGLTRYAIRMGMITPDT